MNTEVNPSEQSSHLDSFVQLLNATATFVNDMQMSREGNSTSHKNNIKSVNDSYNKNSIRKSNQTKSKTTAGVVNGADDDNHVLANVSDQIHFIDVDGPVTSNDNSIIRYDVPFSRSKPIRSLRLRKRLMPDEQSVEEQRNQRTNNIHNSGDVNNKNNNNNTSEKEETDRIESEINVRIILDRVIAPRRWYDSATHATWEQHASPLRASRIDTLHTEELFERKLREMHIKDTGLCPKRALLLAECFLELIRQVVVEDWEQGLLLLHIYRERIAAQIAHRALYESRVGHAFRLALKAEKDVSLVNEEMHVLRRKIDELTHEEAELKHKCDAFANYAEEQTLIAEKQHADAMVALKREHYIKKNQLEHMVMVPPNMERNQK